MLRTVKLVRNSIKGKTSCNGPGIAFDGEGSWSFENDSARNVVIFGHLILIIGKIAFWY